jgi:hypothetical protein
MKNLIYIGWKHIFQVEFLPRIWQLEKNTNEKALKKILKKPPIEKTHMWISTSV